MEPRALFPELDAAPAPPPAERRAGRHAPPVPRSKRPEVLSALYWRAQMLAAETQDRRTYCHEMWLMCIRAMSREPEAPRNTNPN